MPSKIPDDITLAQLCQEAAQALARAGLEHRIDVYREVEVDDPAVRTMLGRKHRIRLRIKITATSLLFDEDSAPEGGDPGLEADSGPGAVSRGLPQGA